MVHAKADKQKNNDDDYDDDDNVVVYIYPAVGTPGYLEAVSSIEKNRASPLYQAPRCRPTRMSHGSKSGTSNGSGCCPTRA
jgi:hypothetical protein